MDIYIYFIQDMDASKTVHNYVVHYKEFVN